MQEAHKAGCAPGSSLPPDPPSETLSGRAPYLAGGIGILLSGLLVFGDVLPSWVAIGSAWLALPLIAAGALNLWRSPLVAAVAALSASAVPGLWIALDRSRSWTGLCLLAASLLTFLIVLNLVNSTGAVRCLSGAVVLAGAIMAVSGPSLFEYESKGRLLWSWKGLGVLGESVDPNVLAGVLAMILPVGLALALDGGRWRHWPSLACLLIGGGLILTESMGGCLAALVSCCLLLACAGRIKWAASLLLSSLMTLFSAGLLLHAQFFDLLHDFLTGRFELWGRAMWLLQEFAFTGVGPRSFGLAANLLHPFVGSPQDQIYPHAHCLWMEVGVETGISGLVAFFLVIALCAIGGWRSVRKLRAERSHYLLIAGFWCGLVAHLLHGLVDSPLWMNRPMPLLFLFLAAPVLGEWRNPSTPGPTLKVLAAWAGLTLVGTIILTWSPGWAIGVVAAGSLVRSWTLMPSK